MPRVMPQKDPITCKFLKKGQKPAPAKTGRKAKATPKKAAAKKEDKAKATARKTKAQKAGTSEQNPWALPAEGAGLRGAGLRKVAARKSEKGPRYDQAIAKLKEILEGL